MQTWNENLVGLFLGTVSEVYSPNHKENISKYQYEYMVQLFTFNNAAMFFRCILSDPMGGWTDEYEDRILTTGTHVFVMFPVGHADTGVILGMPRAASKAQTSPLGLPITDFPHSTIIGTAANTSRRYEKYFLNFTNTIETSKLFGEWTLKHDRGPFVKIEWNKITISDGKMNTIVIDGGLIGADSKITIDSMDVAVKIVKALNVTVGGDVNLTAANVKVTAKDVKALCANVDLTCNKASVTATSLDVKAPGGINLNKLIGGQVLTTRSQPTCYVSGIPFRGVSNVKAG